MSNNQSEINVYPNDEFTQRQTVSSFHSAHIVQESSPEQTISPLPLTDASQVQEQQQQEQQQQGIIRPEPVSVTSTPLRVEAQEFVAAPVTTTSAPSNGPISVTDKDESPVTNPLIFDLKKYKHDYFLSKLSSNFDPNYSRFSSPTGICHLNDDRLLVGNFALDSLLLFDINGNVHQIYQGIPAPKDVLYYSSNPCQAVVAAKKEVVILDLNTKQIVVRSKLKGFYPWNIQFIKEGGIFAACDPSSERIYHLDKNLECVGEISFTENNPDPSRGYQKVYPYAACYFPDNTLFAVTHHGQQCQIKEHDVISGLPTKILNSPPNSLSFSIYGDSKKNCLIADKVNSRLVCIDTESKVEEFKFKSIVEPYSMTFLSDGTLCVTDWNKGFGTNGGVAILSENSLRTNQ